MWLKETVRRRPGSQLSSTILAKGTVSRQEWDVLRLYILEHVLSHYIGSLCLFVKHTGTTLTIGCERESFCSTAQFVHLIKLGQRVLI